MFCMRRVLIYVFKRMGRRSLALFVFGLLSFGYGLVLHSQTLGLLVENGGYVVLNEFLSIHWWSLVWVVSGVLALVGSTFAQQIDGPIFVLLAILFSMWSVSNIITAFLLEPTSIVLAALFFLLTLLTIIIAGWTNEYISVRDKTTKHKNWTTRSND